MKLKMIGMGILSLCLLISLYAGPANKNRITVKQPDGAIIQLRLFGDEFGSFAETLDGYTALRDENGFWVYALKMPDGNLELTNVIVHQPDQRNSNEIQFLAQCQKHLRSQRLPAEEQLRADIQRHINSSRINQLRKSNDKMIWRIIVILVEFTDLAAHESVQSFDDMFNQKDWDGSIGAQGSFNDYYEEVSYEKFGIEADIYGWYTAPYAHTYYAWSNPEHWARARELVRDVITAADPDIDYSRYDNDGDGEVEQVIIVHAGHGAAQEGDESYIWPHYFWLSSPVKLDNVEIETYTMQEELQYNVHAGVGMYCHEFGHALGLPDLYDTNFGDDSNSEGIGHWGIMASGAWGNNGKCPTHLCAWSKMWLGWITPTVVDTSTTQREFELGNIEHNSDQCLKLLPPLASASEYFLLENRQQLGFDSYVPGTGMVIYHLDDRIFNNNNAARKRVDVEEADGLDDLDYFNNRGDIGDPYPGTTFNSLFTQSSYPNSDLYSQAHSGVRVTDIQEKGGLVFAKVEITEPDPSSGVGSDGTVVYYDEFEIYDLGSLPPEWSQIAAGPTFSIDSSVAAHDEIHGDWICLPSQGERAIFVGENWVGSGPAALSLITPELDFSSTVKPMLSFDEIRAWDHRWPSTKIQHTVHIFVTLSGSEVWTRITSIVADTSNFQNWTRQDVDLSAYGGQTIRVAFQFITHHYFWGLDEFTITDVSTGLDESVSKTFASYKLLTNYPNPFNPETIIPFTLPEDAFVELSIYDVLGREVAVLQKGKMGQGSHRISFDASNLSSGIYFYKLIAGDFRQVRKCVFVK